MKPQFIHLSILILMFYLFFTFPDQALDISITPLGRFISVLLILYYASIHKYYGLLMCAFVIFYYQLDCVEGMAHWNGNTILTDMPPKKQTFPKQQYVRPSVQNSEPTLFYQKPDKKSVLLEYENNKIVDIVCCKQTGKCKVNILDQLNDEEDLLYKKTMFR